MNRLRRGGALGLLLLLGVCAVGAVAPVGPPSKEEAKGTSGKQVREPGGTATAAGLAAGQPDEYAWRLFLFINRQALLGTAGVADPAKRHVRDYDDDTDVVWETWALASADDQPDGSEVFLARGAQPQPWDRLAGSKRPPPQRKLDLNFATPDALLLPLDSAALRSRRPLVDLLGTPQDGRIEVRMNRSTFDTIRANGWYSREGLAATVQRGEEAGDRDFFEFQPSAKVVKACWRTIPEAQKPRYHWRKIGAETYGLVALHVITKDLPFWFWCDFIHADVAPGEPANSIHDATTRGPGAPHGQDGVRDETAGSKWANYRLKGSQTAFTDARGTPTRLGDTMIEGGNVARSSCITCHALAAIDRNARRLSLSHPPLGVPPSDAFGDPEIGYLQTDFLFSLSIRAHSTTEQTPGPGGGPSSGPGS